MKPPADDAPLLQRRVYERLVALGMGPTQVPGFEKNYIADLFRSTRPKQQLLGDNLKRLAAALRCTPEFLTDEKTTSPQGQGMSAFSQRILDFADSIQATEDQELAIQLMARLAGKRDTAA